MWSWDNAPYFFLWGSLAILLAAVLLPMQLGARARTLTGRPFNIQFFWKMFFGLFEIGLIVEPRHRRIYVVIFGRRFYDRSLQKEKSPTVEKQSQTVDKKEWIKFFREHRRRAWFHLRRIVATTFGKRAQGTLVFGFNDPATTGEFYGGVCALYPLLGSRWKIDFQPYFLERRLDAACRFSLWLVPLWMLTILGVAIWDLAKPYWALRTAKTRSVSYGKNASSPT